MNIPKRQAEMKMPPKTREQRIAAYRENIPEKYRGTYDKAMQGHSLRKAIDAKCQECQCWQVAEIAKCENVVCPLHPSRPGKSDSAPFDPRRGHQKKKTRKIRLMAGVRQ